MIRLNRDIPFVRAALGSSFERAAQILCDATLGDPTDI
jgi:hypothetical protein